MTFWHVMWRVGTSTFNCLQWTTGPPNNATHCGPLRSFRLFFWHQDDRTARVRVQPNSGILGPNRVGGMEDCNKNHQKHSKKHWSHTKFWDGFILDVNYHTMGPERSIPCLSCSIVRNRGTSRSNRWSRSTVWHHFGSRSSTQWPSAELSVRIGFMCTKDSWEFDANRGRGCKVSWLMTHDCSKVDNWMSENK